MADNNEQKIDQCEESLELSLDQKQRIETKRLKALELRKSRVHSYNPYQRKDQSSSSVDCCCSSNQGRLLIMEDSRGGFMIPDNEALNTEQKTTSSHKVVYQDAVALGDEAMTCDNCGSRFAESFLYSTFNVTICDTCRDPDDKHSLITKTEAKEKFLLKDCDFNDRGGPKLKYLSKPNPHGYHGDMKLFLLSQIKERSYALWNGEDGLEFERQRRLLVREKKKEKSYSKQLKELRSAVYSQSNRSSTSSRSLSHTHEYSTELYDSSTDTWTKSCKQCGQTVTFEKM